MLPEGLRASLTNPLLSWGLDKGSHPSTRDAGFCPQPGPLPSALRCPWVPSYEIGHVQGGMAVDWVPSDQLPRI